MQKQEKIQIANGHSARWLLSKKLGSIVRFHQQKLSSSARNLVCLGYHRQRKEFLAVKQFSKDAVFHDINKIIQLLLKNSNKDDYLLLPLSSIEQSVGENYYQITRFCNRGDLSMYLQRAQKRLKFEEILQIVRMILKGYKKLNSLKICHGDLKLSNIFIDNDRVLIGDFDKAVLNQTDKKYLAKDLNDLKTIFQKIGQHRLQSQQLQQGFINFCLQGYRDFQELDAAFNLLCENCKQVKLKNFGFPFSPQLAILMADVASDAQLHFQHTSQIHQPDTNPNPILLHKINIIKNCWEILDQLSKKKSNETVQQLLRVIQRRIIIDIDECQRKKLDRDCPQQLKMLLKVSKKLLEQQNLLQAFYQQLNQKTKTQYEKIKLQIDKHRLYDLRQTFYRIQQIFDSYKA